MKKNSTIKYNTMPLQKFTDFKKKCHLLFRKKKIMRSDVFEVFPDHKQRQEFANICQDKLNSVEGDERDVFIEQIENFLPSSVKNQLWENNHATITIAITKLIADYGRMPTKNAIAQEAKLSRPTIYKHLKKYSTHHLYKEEKESSDFYRIGLSARHSKKPWKGT